MIYKDLQLDLSQWKSWFSNFRNYVPRIDWGLLPEWRIYRVALRNGDHIGPENWGPKRCNHPSEIGYLGQEADLVTDWCMSVIPFFYKRYSLDPIKVGQRKIVSIELRKHFPKARLRVIDKFGGCTPPLVIVKGSVNHPPQGQMLHVYLGRGRGGR